MVVQVNHNRMKERRSVLSFNCSDWLAKILTGVSVAGTFLIGAFITIGVNEFVDMRKSNIDLIAVVRQQTIEQVDRHKALNARINDIETWRHNEVDPKLWDAPCPMARCDRLRRDMEKLGKGWDQTDSLGILMPEKEF
jgi:hypothetical protein